MERELGYLVPEKKPFGEQQSKRRKAKRWKHIEDLKTCKHKLNDVVIDIQAFHKLPLQCRIQIRKREK